MISFEYSRSSNVADAVRQMAASPAAKFVAGGTNLVDLMKMDVERPAKLIDISRLPLDKVEETAGGGLRIGALVRNSDLAYHPLVEQRFPVLSSAVLAGASQQLRNMASTGGNLLQRTRCPYFYDIATPCNKREPGSGCSAIDGLNRMNAILGTSDACIAVHPSDMCVALAVLEAKVHVTGPRGERVIAFADFHRLPADTPQRDTNLNADELVTSIELPPRGFATNYTYLRSATGSLMRSRSYRSRSGLSLRATPSKRRVSRSAASHTSPGATRGPRRRCAAVPPARRRLHRQPISCWAKPRASGTTRSRSISRAGPSSARCRRRRAARRSRSPTRRSREQPMAPYIGTATSRVDGIAKVTGAAKYAAEFNVPGLAHGSVVCSTIAKGRITRMDTSAAMRVEGVLTVLTHENRPPMANNDQAYKDEAAPPGSPFRPLYDNKIMFNGQPIGLVVAETSDIARFAASLVRVEYNKEAHVTDVYRQRDEAVPPKPPTNPFEAMFTPPRTRGAPEQALAAAAVRHEGEYYVPIEHHNPMELFASTVIFEGNGKLTVYDKTQGVQNVQKYLCGVFGMKPEDVRVMSPFMGGGFRLRAAPAVSGGAGGARGARAAALGACRADAAADVCAGLPARDDLAHRYWCKRRGTLDAITHDAVTVTSQYEDHHRQETGWSGLLYKCANAKYEHRLARLDLATSCDMRAPSAASAVYALECAMDELAVALRLDPLELRLRCYSDRDQHDDRPYSSKALRECYRQGAEAFGWDKRTPEPRSMRDGSELVGWGMATGIWEALQVPITVRIVLTANGHAEVACATSDIGTGTYTIMAQVAADMLGLPLDNISVKLGDFEFCRNRRSKADRGLRPRCRTAS